MIRNTLRKQRQISLPKDQIMNSSLLQIYKFFECHFKNSLGLQLNEVADDWLLNYQNLNLITAYYAAAALQAVILRPWVIQAVREISSDVGDESIVES